MAEQVHQTEPAAADGVEVVRELTRAEAEISVAIDAFRRAQRMRLTELFRPSSTDPDQEGAEEVHVGHGVSALLNARRHVTIAAERVHSLPTAPPDRRRLGPPVRTLDARVNEIIDALHARQEPSRLVAHLKRARRAIPTRVVRDYTKG